MRYPFVMVIANTAVDGKRLWRQPGMCALKATAPKGRGFHTDMHRSELVVHRVFRSVTGSFCKDFP